MVNRNKKGRFVSQKTAAKVEAGTANLNKINEKRRQLKKVKNKEDPGKQVACGRRILSLHVFARNMWCKDCDIPLSLIYLEEEKLFGLTPVFYIRCYKCLGLKEVHGDSKAPPAEGCSRSLYSANMKAALGKSP